MAPHPDQPFVDHCLELLGSAGGPGESPRARRMFGGWGLSLGPWFVALIADRQLYLKVDDQTRAAFAAAGGRAFVYEAAGKAMAMHYWTVPEEAMDAPVHMAPWARLALAAAVRAAARAPRPSARKPPGSRAAVPAPRRRAKGVR